MSRRRRHSKVTPATLNASRLTTSQRTLLAATMCRESGIFPREAGRLVGVSHQSVYTALELLDQGDAATLAAIARGERSVGGASGSSRRSYCVALPRDLHERLRALSAASGVTMKVLAQRAVAAYVSLAERTPDLVSEAS